MCNETEHICTYEVIFANKTVTSFGIYVHVLRHEANCVTIVQLYGFDLPIRRLSTWQIFCLNVTHIGDAKLCNLM